MDKNLHITIELFGMHGVIADTDRIQMPITGKTTVNDAIDYIKKKYPGMIIHQESILIAVNHQVVPSVTALRANDTVSLLPHIGGG
jgi:molybdopterin converting factor small subunit